MSIVSDLLAQPALAQGNSDSDTDQSADSSVSKTRETVTQKTASPVSPSGSPYRGLGSGYLMVGSLVVGLSLGFALDNYYGSEPKALIICSLLFIGFGMYHVVREANK